MELTYGVTYSFLKKLIVSEVESIISGIEQRFSYLIEGEHGIGKSAFWKEICIEHNGFMIDMRLGQRDLGDIIGMPFVDDINNNKHFLHILPEIIRPAFVNDLSELGVIGNSTYQDKLLNKRPKESSGKSFDFVLLFLDEYNRGTKDVQQAVFEIVYDRTMNGKSVHPKTFIATACNDNIEVYTITEGDPAFRSRFRSYKFKPTVNEWLEWGKKTGELCSDLIFVISTIQNGKLADPPREKLNDGDFLNKPHPNRRSWHEFSKWYEKNKSNFTNPEIQEVCSGFVGMEAAIVFIKAVASMKEIQKDRIDSVKSESENVNKIFSEYIGIKSKWNYHDVCEHIKNLNTSELNELAQKSSEYISNLKWISPEKLSAINQLLKILPLEISTNLIKNIDDRYEFKTNRWKTFCEKNHEIEFYNSIMNS